MEQNQLKEGGGAAKWGERERRWRGGRNQRSNAAKRLKEGKQAENAIRDQLGVVRKF